ncbi:MAG: hypothetical protein M1812_006671 [Candelaria pacifica]|nr:MAG: hypothetical protein M1812_006671 [Candelaria pacifica]
MATYAHNNFDLYRPTAALSLDTKHKYFDEDDSSILDDTILDSGALDMSPMSGRRESFADTASVFSSGDGNWGDIQIPGRQPANSTNPFFGQSNNPFIRAQHAAFGQQNGAWAMEGDSGTCTPTADYEAFGEYDNNTATSYMSSALPPTASNIYSGLATSHSQPSSVFSSGASAHASIPTSPHSGNEWMMSASEALDQRPIPKRMHPSSPSFRSDSPMMRRDGIRKKNARFDIPPGRNLYTIDKLIAQSNNENEVKELKQQKRLLRNRQAALDSRQRKKQHTEKLEEEKKTYTTVISDLEDELADMKIREAEYFREKEDWNISQQQYKQYIDSLHLEKEEMVRSHTLETGDLRKKNAVLTELVQKAENTAMSGVPSSSGFSTEFSDIDSITMEGSAWDSFSFVNDFAMEPEPRPENAIVVQPKKSERVIISNDEKPAASGLLLMLLLCGAFVASRGTQSSPAIPRMSDDIRAASATVLDNIFKDAGVQPSDPRLNTVNRVEALEPGPSNTAWPAPRTTLTAAELVGITGSSPLDVLNHQQLTAPTKEQEQEQLFSLSVDQYNGITSQDFLREPEPPSTSQHRRHLGESLAAMRANRGESAAEVYTRSLMWDKIPTEVVRDFAKMVEHCNANSRADGRGDADTYQ